jgi:tetratricopeptide (TPR) repeat protein
LEHLSRTEEAIVLLQRAIEIDAKFANAWFNLGQFRLRQGKLDEALTSLEATLKLDSKHKAAHYEMGNLFFARKDYKSAETWAHRAVKLDATNPAPLYLLSRTLLRLGRREEGKDLAGKALKLRLESDKKSRIQLKKNVSVAIEYFKEILKYDPTNRQARSALISLADAYEKTGKMKVAAAIRALLKPS